LPSPKISLRGAPGERRAVFRAAVLRAGVFFVDFLAAVLRPTDFRAVFFRAGAFDFRVAAFFVRVDLLRADLLLLALLRVDFLALFVARRFPGRPLISLSFRECLREQRRAASECSFYSTRAVKMRIA
jgi:hypothetical protein